MFQTNNNNKPKLQLKPNLGGKPFDLVLYFARQQKYSFFNLTTFFFGLKSNGQIMHQLVASMRTTKTVINYILC